MIKHSWHIFIALNMFNLIYEHNALRRLYKHTWHQFWHANVITSKYKCNFNNENVNKMGNFQSL